MNAVCLSRTPEAGILATGSFIHPLVKAAILHFWIAYEHPYVDGNGRTARAVFYWFMLKEGYWLFEFLTISRIIKEKWAQYYRSFLYSEDGDNDLTYSILFQLRATQQALKKLHEYLAEKREEQANLATLFQDYPDLNHRQRALLGHALEHPQFVYTFQSHQRSHNISYPTARADLLGLQRRGLLASTDFGKQTGFVPASPLLARFRTSARKRTRE